MNENNYHRDETFNMSYKELYYNLYREICQDNQCVVKCELYDNDNKYSIYLFIFNIIYIYILV